MQGPGTRGPGTPAGPAMPLAVLLVLLVFGLAVAPSGAFAIAYGDGAVEGTLRAHETISGAGDLELASEQATLELSGLDEFSPVLFTASRLVVNVSWERGVDATPPGEPVILKRIEESGSRTLVFDNASVQLDHVRADAQVVAFAGGPGASFSTTISDVVQVRAVEDHLVARSGSSSENTEVGGSPSVGFDRKIWGPSVAALAPATASVTGNFSAFVNNLTLTVSHEEGTWQNWTGYREENATLASTGAGPTDLVGSATGSTEATDAGLGVARTYERRVVTLEVRDGWLALQAPVPTGFYARDMTGLVDGTVRVPGAHGSLATPAGTVALSGQQVEISGEGRLDLSAVDGRRSEGAFSGPGAARGDALLLQLIADGHFEVFSQDPLLLDRAGTEPTGRLAALPFSLSPWLLLPFMLLAGLGVYLAYPWVSWEARRGYGRWRRKLFDQRLRTGRELHRQGNLVGAADAYRQAAAWAPDDGVDLLDLADAQAMVGDAQGALATLDRAEDRGVWVGRADSLELRVVCHNELGQDAETVQALTDLAGISQSTAADLVYDLELWELAEQIESLQDLIKSNASHGLGDQGGLDGYV